MSGPTNHLYGRWKEIEVMKKFEPDREALAKIARNHQKKTLPVRKMIHSFPQVLGKKYKVEVITPYIGTTFSKKLSPFEIEKYRRMQEKVLRERDEVVE